MTNRERLEAAEMINLEKPLTPEQSDALEILTSDEVDELISIKTKLSNQLGSPENLFFVTMHYEGPLGVK